MNTAPFNLPLDIIYHMQAVALEHAARSTGAHGTMTFTPLLLLLLHLFGGLNDNNYHTTTS